MHSASNLAHFVIEYHHNLDHNRSIRFWWQIQINTGRQDYIIIHSCMWDVLVLHFFVLSAIPHRLVRKMDAHCNIMCPWF